MAIVHWTPFSEIDRLQRQMNRLFDDFSIPNWKEEAGFVGTPAAELSETNEALLLKIEVPGIDPKDINIEVTKNSVSISGERKQETKSEENGVTRSEFRYGNFQRVIPLPSHIENNNVAADYKDGILTLTLPKAEEEKNKVVKVNIG